MFSLIIAIVAVLLVAALSLAVIYYGGSAFNEGEASAQASKVINQGQQVLGAAELFKAEKGRWPNSTDELVSEHYLRGVPIASALTPVQASGKTWVMPRAGVPVFRLQQVVAQPVCQNINLKTRGDDGILKRPLLSAATQCYGDPADAFNVVVAKSSEDLAAVEQATLPSVPGRESSDWAVKPAEAATAANEPPEEKGGDENLAVYFRSTAAPVLETTPRTVVFRFENPKDDKMYAALDLGSLRYGNVLNYEAISSTCAEYSLSWSYPAVAVPPHTSCTMTVRVSWNNPILLSGKDTHSAEVYYSTEDQTVSGMTAVPTAVPYGDAKAQPQHSGSCTDYGPLKVCTPYVGTLSDARSTARGIVTVENTSDQDAYYRYASWNQGQGLTPDGVPAAHITSRRTQDCEVVDEGFEYDWQYWVVKVPPGQTCSMEAAMNLDSNAKYYPDGVSALLPGTLLNAGWDVGGFRYGTTLSTQTSPPNPPMLLATFGEVTGSVKLQYLDDGDRFDNTFTYEVWSSGNKSPMQGTFTFTPTGSYLLSGAASLQSITGSCVSGNTVSIPTGAGKHCVVKVKANYVFSQAYPSQEEYAELGALRITRSDGEWASTTVYATQPETGQPDFEVSYQDAFGLFSNSAGCTSNCMNGYLHACQVGQFGIVQCGTQYSVPVNLEANYAMGSYDAACQSAGSAAGANRCQVNALNAQTGKSCRMTGVPLDNGTWQYAIVCR